MAETNLSRRKFIALGGATAGIAALSGLVACSSGGSSSSAAASSVAASSSATASASSGSGGKVDTDLAKMSWEDILAEAKGQTVTFLA